MPTVTAVRPGRRRSASVVTGRPEPFHTHLVTVEDRTVTRRLRLSRCRLGRARLCWRLQGLPSLVTSALMARPVGDDDDGVGRERRRDVVAVGLDLIPRAAQGGVRIAGVLVLA